MKEQCDIHGCSELLCGCHTSVLQASGIYEQVKAKNKWIDELLKENEELKKTISELAPTESK